MVAIFGEGKIFENCHEYIAQIPCGSKILMKLLYLARLRRQKQNLLSAIFGKNSKIQNGRHFWGGENFLKIVKSTFLGYPVGSKIFNEIALSRTVKEIEANLCFSILAK